MSSQLSFQAEGSTKSTAPERRKRTKYVAKACNECKRRKIKCGGQQPCERCWRLSVECEYPADNSTNSVSQNVKKLLEQVQSLQSQVDYLSSRPPPASSLSARASPLDLGSSHGDHASDGTHDVESERGRERNHERAHSARRLSFHGLTTSSVDFGIARQSLRSRGITDLDKPGDTTQEPTPLPSPPPLSLALHQDGLLQSIEPFWTVSREETLRLCRVYEEEMGRMYPVVDMEATVSLVHALYNHLGSYSFTGGLPAPPPPFTNEDVNVLNMVFACALTAEGNGHNELALRIFRRVREPLAETMWRPPEIHRAIMLTLASIFLFQTDEEALAWRTIGTVQRMCMEMGLHRAETYTQPSIVAIGREKVVRLFWSVYTLDVRWSMGTGMPNHLNFVDIDPTLPRPTDQPYLNTMVDYCRTYQKVWKFVTNPSSNADYSSRAEELEYLDWQAMQWYLHVPEQLKLPSPESMTSLSISNSSRSSWRLKALLYLRGNMIRILLHRPVLLKAEHIAMHPSKANAVVEIAKSSIRLITHMNQVSDIYRLQQVVFNWFLVSALAVLFLAVAQAPAQFASSCRDEFYMVLELVEGFSMNSYVSRRLWKSIRNLRTLAPQMGLRNQNQPQDPATSAASEAPLADAAAHTVAAPILDSQGLTGIRALDDAGSEELQVDGTQMSRDLMDLYKAMGEPVGGTDDSSNPFGPGQWSSVENFWFGSESELAEIFKDCF